MPDKNIIDKIINAILQVIIPDKIILFGSQARGQARADSDYDILIIKDKLENISQVEGNIYVNFIGIGVPIELIIATDEIIEKNKKRSVSVIKEALSEGIVIYG